MNYVSGAYHLDALEKVTQGQEMNEEREYERKEKENPIPFVYSSGDESWTLPPLHSLPQTSWVL